MREALEALLTEEQYVRAAERFARKYSNFDPVERLGAVADAIERVL